MFNRSLSWLLMVVESSHTFLLHFNCIIVMQLSVNHDYKGYVKCVSYVRQLVDSRYRVYATVLLAGVAKG